MLGELSGRERNAIVLNGMEELKRYLPREKV